MIEYSGPANPEQLFGMTIHLLSCNFPHRIAFGFSGLHGRTAMHFSTEFNSNSTYSTSSNFFKQTALKRTFPLAIFMVGLKTVKKIWLFSDSVEGANASAVVYTMVEMAKAHDLNIYGYLKFLLEHRPTKDMTDAQLAELAPWSEKLQSIKNRM